MKILGIDPGSNLVGFAVIEKRRGIKLLDAGCIKIESKNFEEGLLYLNEGLEKILIDEIDEVAIEDIFFAYNPKSVLKLAQYRGAIAMKVLEKYQKFYTYTPLQIKRAVTGKGKATKEQVAFMVKRVLGIKNEIKPLDITDAIAVAVTHSQQVKL